jgi:hypothetical protein
MIHKISLKKLEEKIAPYLKENNYLSAGILAENYGFKKLSEKYYNACIESFKNKTFINRIIKKTNVFPSKECHQEIIERILKIEDFKLSTYSIKN